MIFRINVEMRNQRETSTKKYVNDHIEIASVYTRVICSNKYCGQRVTEKDEYRRATRYRNIGRRTRVEYCTGQQRTEACRC
jgi:hypothetical protein